jgi:diguanylate cyclase (GGDEF)-like protein
MSLPGLRERKNNCGASRSIPPSPNNIRPQIPLKTHFFKHFNDANGHLQGDLCLMAVAQEIQSCLRRPGDFVARFGGEEFVVILPNTNDQDAARLFDEIRCQVKLLRILHPNSSVSPYVTISVGSSTTILTRGESYLDFLQEADLALYRAKAYGHDQSVHDSAIPLEIA